MVRNTYQIYTKPYRNTPIGRAVQLVNRYIHNDKEHKRIEKELPPNYITPKWVVENIFSKPCAHCGKEGWRVIGCNRVDNSLPHTKDNVEPCCRGCNIKLATEKKKNILSKQVDQISIITGEILASFPSTQEAARILGYNQSGICMCCNGKIKKYKGYEWKYHS